jgi:mannose-6-phosphate isomerase-like protein (cupin superfamily)
MSTTVEQVFATPQGKYLVDPYDNWARAEGVPIHAGASIDMLAIVTKPWARFGVDGAICHLDGRDDFLTIFVFDLAPGAMGAPMRHLYEDVCYVLSGHGVAEIDLPGGGTKTIEWGPKSVFSAPMNATMRLRNTSSKRARIASVNDFRYLM